VPCCTASSPVPRLASPAGRSTPPPPELVAICSKATAARPAGRYRDARALAVDLEAWFEGRRVGAYHTTPLRLARRLMWAWRAPITVGVVASAVLGFALFDGWQRTTEERNRAVSAEAEAVVARGAADAALAASLAAQARTAESAGDRMRAEVLASEALLRVPDDPEARGVLVRFAGHPRPQRLAWSPLPGCRAVSLSPDGQALACATAGGVRVRDLAGGTERVLSGDVSRVAFAGHAETLVGVRGRELLRWQGLGAPEVLATGMALTSLDGDGPAGAATVIGRGHVYAVSSDGGVDETGSGCGRRGHSMQATHPGGTLAAVCADGRRVLVQDAAGSRILPVPAEAGAAMSVAVSTPDADRIAIGTVDGVVRVHDRHTGALLLDEQVSSGAAPRLALHRGTLAVASSAGFVTVLRLDGRAPVRLPGEATALRWIGDGARLRVAGADGLSEWALPDAGAPAVHRFGSGLASVDLSPDGASLLTAHGDGSVVVRRRADGEERLRRRLHHSVAKDAAFSPDGSRLAVGHAVRFELPLIGAPAWTPVGALGDEKVRRVAWLRDGLLLVAPYAHGLRAWREGVPLGLGPTGQVFDLAASADGQTAAAFDEHGGLWHIDPGAVPAAIRVGQDDQVAAIAALSTGVLAAAEDHATWIDRDGRVRASVPLAGGPVLDVAVAPDGTRAATAHLDGAVRLWSLPEGAPLAVLRGHTARTVSLCFTADGGTLLSGSWDGTARVWPLGPLDADPGRLRDDVVSDWAVTLDEIIRRPADP
jgi:WD40 repeat protein